MQNQSAFHGTSNYCLSALYNYSWIMGFYKITEVIATNVM